LRHMSAPSPAGFGFRCNHTSLGKIGSRQGRLPRTEFAQLRSKTIRDSERSSALNRGACCSAIESVMAFRFTLTAARLPAGFGWIKENGKPSRAWACMCRFTSFSRRPTSARFVPPNTCSGRRTRSGSGLAWRISLRLRSLGPGSLATPNVGIFAATCSMSLEKGPNLPLHRVAARQRCLAIRESLRGRHR
jgi:hypothetical protein